VKSGTPSPPFTVKAALGGPSANPGRVPASRKLAYGIGNIAYSLPYQATASLFMLFATAILGVPPAVAGLVGALSIAWDALTDPVVGYLSDHAESPRFGRRHLFILAGGLGIALFNYTLWTISPASSLALRVGLIAVSLLLLKTALAVFFVPYLALGGELSQDYDQRSSIQGIRAAFYLVGMILALFATPVFFFRSTPQFPRGQLNPAAYPRMALASSLVAAIATLVCFLGTRRSIPTLPRRTVEMGREGRSARSVWTNFVEALKNRELLMLVLMIFVLEAGFQFGIAIGFHVNTYTYGLTGPMIGVLGLVVLGTSVLSQPLWVAFTKRFEKKTALIAGLTIGFVGFIGAPWTHVWWKIFPIQAPTLLFTLGAFMVLAGIGNGAFMSIPNSMIADAADVEELRTGKRDEGLYFGTYTLAYKAGTAVSWALSGAALAAIHFAPGSTSQSESVRFALAMVPTYLLLATAPFALYFILRYGITRERWRQTRAALDARRESPT
jgi:glycoside/pentoside/hexuronide:cation symporter, GPH family